MEEQRIQRNKDTTGVQEKQEKNARKHLINHRPQGYMVRSDLHRRTHPPQTQTEAEGRNTLNYTEAAFLP